MKEYMKENGMTIIGMEEDMNGIQMEIFISENFNLGRLMVKGNMNGKTQMKFMMENGQKE
jgi:hypothetical protein